MTKKKMKITDLTKSLMDEKNTTDVADLQSVLKEMLKSGVETLLEYSIFIFEYHFLSLLIGFT
ncbi:MAG: hypothetical protein N4A76_16275 [Firmicutes bacterium]|nr:hypothetical protein [Bacillota bacterium]